MLCEKVEIEAFSKGGEPGQWCFQVPPIEGSDEVSVAETEKKLNVLSERWLPRGARLVLE